MTLTNSSFIACIELTFALLFLQDVCIVYRQQINLACFLPAELLATVAG